MRNVRDEKFLTGRVDYSAIAPHHYTEKFDSNFRDAKWDEFRKSIPYKEGDVIWVECDGKTYREKIAKPARIIGVFVDRSERRTTKRLEKYRVQFAKKDGNWAKIWYYVFPGYIQRGYDLAKKAVIL